MLSVNFSDCVAPLVDHQSIGIAGGSSHSNKNCVSLNATVLQEVNCRRQRRNHVSDVLLESIRVDQLRYTMESKYKFQEDDVILCLPHGGTHGTTIDLNNICRTRRLDEAIDVVHFYDKQGILLSQHIIFFLIQKCMEEMDVASCRELYSLMVSNGLDSVAFLSNHVVRLLAMSGNLQEAFIVFCRISNPTIYTWHTILSGCCIHGDRDGAFVLFDKMQQKGVEPNEYIFTSILKVCASTGAIMQGKMIHNQIIRHGLMSNAFVGSTLIDMYARCNRIDQARKVFDNLPSKSIVSWNTMIGGYVNHGFGSKALELFGEMLGEGVEPNKVTFLSILKACGITKSVGLGLIIHRQAVESGLELDVHVGSTLIDMYAKCGALIYACQIFHKLPFRDVFSWAAIISGYVQHSDGICALKLFERMQGEGIRPDMVTFSCALQACTNVGALQKGKKLHNQIVETGLKVDTTAGSILIDMYAKCGDLDAARRVLDDLSHLDVRLWGAMISGYATHGEYKLTQDSFETMQENGLKPNAVIYTSVLKACSHAGKVIPGQKYFRSMIEDHGIKPSIEHFGCMADLLAQWGYLNEAQDLLESMPLAPDLTSWMSLLTGCWKFQNVVMGRHCFDRVVHLDSSIGAGHVLMMQIYAHFGMWDNVHDLQELKKCGNVWKKPGKAWIEVDMVVHEFTVGDNGHPKQGEICMILERLKTSMEEEGYISELELMLEPISIQDREDAACRHYKKRATAFDSFNLQEGATIQILKNLLMCIDYHNCSTMISKFEEQQKISGDEHCVHHFENGHCCCHDYSW